MTKDEARAKTDGLGTVIFDILAPGSAIIPYAQRAVKANEIAEILHNMGVDVTLERIAEPMGITGVLGIPFSQYYVLKAVVDGEALYLNNEQALEMACGLKVQVGTIDDLVTKHYLNRVGRHFIATDKAKELMARFTLGKAATA